MPVARRRAATNVTWTGALRAARRHRHAVGAEGARLTAEAKAGLARLTRRPMKP